MGTDRKKPLRALIIEDSEDDARLLVRELERGGYAPVYERVDTPEAVAAALDRHDWDVIFGDFTMPRFTGLEALALVRSHRRDVPFIFVSGTIGEDMAVAAVKAGASDYILKNSLKRLPLAVERELREAELRREHRASEMRFRNILTIAADAVIMTDQTQRIVMFNQGAEAIFGYRAEEVTGRLIDVLLPERLTDVHRRHMESFARAPDTARRMGERGEVFGRRKDGTEFPAEASISKLTDGDQTTFTVILRDISERKRAEERMHYLAHFDALTGLPNRVVFQDRLAQNAINASRHHRVVGVMLIDLDRFKAINDTLGHPAGDDVLKAVAERLKTCVRKGDTVARLGGDEFAVILADMAHVEDAAGLARKILGTFSEPFRVGSHDLFVTASIGITLYPADDALVDNLLKNADTAMYRAKELGRNTYQFYTAEMNAKVMERLNLETRLRQARERNDFDLQYQPQVDLVTRRIVGVEALIRWVDPDRGAVSPAEFIPVAEEVGLIIPIGEWVLRAACTQAKAWQDAGVEPIRIAVNVSAVQFRHAEFVATVARTLRETGLPPALLELEITESLLIAPEPVVLNRFLELHELGVTFTIDDFGTGYSSLSYLKRFPIETLKIDRSFVRNIIADPEHAAIASAIVSLAHNLKLRVVAEGVETDVQSAFLRSLGCDAAQGYLYSRPLTADAIEPRLLLGRIL